MSRSDSETAPGKLADRDEHNSEQHCKTVWELSQAGIQKKEIWKTTNQIIANKPLHMSEMY